ncbi:MAG: hypothetical protein GY869_14360, partial [Planctomycetes bacterium]|nr:hypothetical protein [Planctomycetota bacterium]
MFTTNTRSFNLSEMHTYRGGSNWNSAMWPTGATGPSDVTQWHYHEASGLLTAKEYADGNQTTYTYVEGGKLESRTWARLFNGNPLTTTYAYDPDTGELLSIDYSDDTPDISFTYDRLGRYINVSDAFGSRVFVYNEKLQLEFEKMSGLQNFVINRKYQNEGFVGRSAGFSLGADYNVSYRYDNVGRLDAVSWTVGGLSQTTTYDYLADSNLIERFSTNDGFKTSYTYDPKRNIKSRVSNEFGSNSISQYDYTHDELGRITTVANNGQAFDDPAFNLYNYNDRNELVESSRYLGAGIIDTSNPVQSEYRGYEYDPIGNRVEIYEATDTISYETNSLNQHTTLAGPEPETLIYDEDGNLSSRSSGVEYVYRS